MTSIIKKHIDTQEYREIKAQIIYQQQQPTDLLIYLFSKKYHQVDVTRIHLKTDTVLTHYHLNTADFAAQKPIHKLTCPDDTLQFLTFAPNNENVEQITAQRVANAAMAQHFKTLQLTHYIATRQNYLNAMSCPKLLGNFYDGDGYHNPDDPDGDFIITIDGVIQASDIIKQIDFHLKTVSLWVACSIYNDPIKRAMQYDAHAQKFAAGINDLLVGPADDTAACAMIAAINGQPMTQAFKDCYTIYDQPEDIWGFGGSGADYFGQ